jgi:hypothetical protein
MNANYKRVPTAFGPDTRFELNPAPPAPFRVLAEDSLERLKNRLLEERLRTAVAGKANSALRRAANEAAALAWVTPYPLLVFPGLFDEKADFAVLQIARQAGVRRRSSELLAA